MLIFLWLHNAYLYAFSKIQSIEFILDTLKGGNNHATSSVRVPLRGVLVVASPEVLLRPGTRQDQAQSIQNQDQHQILRANEGRFFFSI